MPYGYVHEVRVAGRVHGGHDNLLDLLSFFDVHVADCVVPEGPLATGLVLFDRKSRNQRALWITSLK